MKITTYLFVLFISFNLFAEQRQIPEQDLVYMQTSDGLIVIELVDEVAPNHVSRFKALVEEGFYQGLDFYRVINGFVAQAGEGELDQAIGKQSRFKTPLKAEFTRAIPDNSNFELVQSPALLAPQTGFIKELAAGRDLNTQEEWLLHCPGMVSMARNNHPDTAATEFYINIGQAPRHLDRNMSTFGRVVYGLEVAQRMKRGDRKQGGIVLNNKERSKILWVKMGNKVEPNIKMNFYVDLFNSQTFQRKLTSAKKRTHQFYVYSGNGNIDVCYTQPDVYVKK